MLANSRVEAMLPTVDLARARRFYQEKLGLQPTDIADGLRFECGEGTALGLYERSTPTKADHTAAAWQVADIAATVRALRERGVVFEQYDLPGLKTDKDGIARLGPVAGAWFKDPDGNILGLVQFE